MEFIGRTRELTQLEAIYSERSSGFLPIYGRRRIGKSELILRFLEKRPGIYFVGKQAPPEFQMREFLRAAAAVTDQPLLASITPKDWKQALSEAVRAWKGRGKLVLALDEFQWIAESSPEIISILQELWDREWAKSGRVLLILCGSYIGFMEREVLGERSPLFGRRTGQILLRPFDHREAALFHPGYSLVDRARTYFVCGGVPLYLRWFDPGRSVEMNIARNYFDEFAPLNREADFLLREELREVTVYHAILAGMAAGHTTNSHIARHAGLNDRALHYYLQQLVELGYVSRRFPLTGQKPSPRQVRYILDEPVLRFWFRFVFPNISLARAQGPDRAYAQVAKPEFDAYCGLCFERLCREALPGIYQAEGVTAQFEVGEFWSPATQIDVVGQRGDGWTDLGECKWGAVRSIPALARDLEEKVAAYPNPRNATIGRRIFSRLKPPGRQRLPEGLRWHSLEEIYGLA